MINNKYEINGKVRNGLGELWDKWEMLYLLGLHDLIHLRIQMFLCHYVLPLVRRHIVFKLLTSSCSMIRSVHRPPHSLLLLLTWCFPLINWC